MSKTIKKFELLKEELYNNGTDFIDEFLGYKFNYNLPKTELDKKMYKKYKEMSEIDFEHYLRDYNIK